ncbi:uncharacterized protein LOC135311806 [Phalacrocorax carbo]|uniref:uncharacterized protein LOC135311806 n=1 Tax=Phalacrocorax carbo TaxID=9209 RepID=UPI0031195DB8
MAGRMQRIGKLLYSVAVLRGLSCSGMQLARSSSFYLMWVPGSCRQLEGLRAALQPWQGLDRFPDSRPLLQSSALSGGQHVQRSSTPCAPCCSPGHAASPEPPEGAPCPWAELASSRLFRSPLLSGAGPGGRWQMQVHRGRQFQWLHGEVCGQCGQRNETLQLRGPCSPLESVPTLPTCSPAACAGRGGRVPAAAWRLEPTGLGASFLEIQRFLWECNLSPGEPSGTLPTSDPRAGWSWHRLLSEASPPWLLESSCPPSSACLHNPGPSAHLRARGTSWCQFPARSNNTERGCTCMACPSLWPGTSHQQCAGSSVRTKQGYTYTSWHVLTSARGLHTCELLKQPSLLLFSSL